MSYSIKPSESLPDAVRRILSEQIAKARAALTDSETQAQGIHKARKHLKKIRALLRLIRDGLGEKVYRQQNIYYRDLGRELSGLRDATSVLESLQLLKKKFRDQLSKETFQELEDVLLEEREAVRQTKDEEASQIEKVLTGLAKADGQIEQLSLSKKHWPDLLKSHKRVYKRGYKAFIRSFDHPSTEEVHEWRKRAKYLWYHNRLLKPAWHPVFSGFAKVTHQLSDLIGDHRDLALLIQQMEALEARLDPDNRQVLEAIARQYQKNMFIKAQRLGRKIYAEKPALYQKRVGSYLKTWRSV